MDFALTVEVGVCVCIALCTVLLGATTNSLHDSVLLCPNPDSPVLPAPNKLILPTQQLLM